MAQNNPKNYATIKNPTIAAAIDGLFKFQTRAQAEDRLQGLKESFIIAKESGLEDAVLWIKDFVTEAEKKDGYTGNYARVTVEKVDDKYTLKAEKIEKDKKFHPKRVRTKHSHPNWGHPMLRGLKKGHIYASALEAQTALDKLHEEFPTVTIPAQNKLYVMVFSRETKPPVQKYVLEIKLQQDGKCKIEYALNTYKPTKPAPAEKPIEEPAPTGYFTSMVTMRKKKKRK